MRCAMQLEMRQHWILFGSAAMSQQHWMVWCLFGSAEQSQVFAQYTLLPSVPTLLYNL